MKTTTLSKIFSIFNTTTNNDAPVNDISTDTRTIKPENFFIPVKGTNFDGHNYIETAFYKGASGAVAELPCFEALPAELKSKVIPVDDALEAMLTIAKRYREQFSFPITAVTGSNGKTTVKDLLTHIMSSKYKTCGTKGNFNNEIGVPKTIFEFDDTTEYAVVEIGMRGKNQIARLCDILRPTSAAITNIGEAHIEILGSREAIAQAKAEVAEKLPKDGFLVMNGDDQFASYIEKLSPVKVFFFGSSPICDLKLINLTQNSYGSAFQIQYKGEKAKTEISLPGIHNVYNAMAAILSSVLAGLPLKSAAERIGSAKISEKRSEIIVKNSRTIINDCYNSNPSSASAALDILSGFNMPKAAILGDMLELGDISERSHYELGKKAASCGLELLIAIGEKAASIIKGAKDNNMDTKACIHLNTADEFQSVKHKVPKNIAVLIKASNSMELWKITKLLTE